MTNTSTLEIPVIPAINDGRSSAHVFRFNGRRYKMGQIPAGDSARQEQGGPMVPAPQWAVADRASWNIAKGDVSLCARGAL